MEEEEEEGEKWGRMGEEGGCSNYNPNLTIYKTSLTTGNTFNTIDSKWNEFSYLDFIYVSEKYYQL